MLNGYVRLTLQLDDFSMVYYLVVAHSHNSAH